jgi:anti-sigma regulatory factor (Ser/Thr protein kinase)
MKHMPRSSDHDARHAERHSVLVYETVEEFLATIVPFVGAGVEQGDAVIAVAARANLIALRETLGRMPPWVRFVDDTDWYARGPRTMGRWTSFVDTQVSAGRRQVRVVGEVVWPSDRNQHWEMTRFEVAATLAFDTRPVLVVCPYNVATLPDTVIDAALATHPGVIRKGATCANPAFIDPHAFVAPRIPTLEPPTAHVSKEFAAYDISSAARFVEGRARLAGLQEAAVQRLTAAVSELALNAAVHTGGSIRVAAWQGDGAFVCQVEDEGAGIADPGVGFQPPSAGDPRWGLWQIRDAVDRIEFGRTGRGSVVRLCMTRGARSRAGAHHVLSRL